MPQSSASYVSSDHDLSIVKYIPRSILSELITSDSAEWIIPR